MVLAHDTADLIARTASRRANRRLPAISGGGPDTLPEPIIRKRLRTLIDSGVLPPGGLGCLWEWICRHQHSCSGCGAAIVPGAVEVEINTRGGIVLFLHLRCLELWAEEARPERRRGLA
jgi:ribosomal protein L24E